jgi:putative addiction module component (TIGR02574 family)
VRYVGISRKLIEEALSLPPDERAAVAERLLSSLEPELSQIDQLWAAEAEDRLNAYDRGEIEAIPADEVFKTVKNRER